MSLPDERVPLPASRRAGMMRRLTIDIETRPNLVYAWSLWGEQHVTPSQLVSPVDMVCFAAKWNDEKKVRFYSEWEHGREAMVRAAWELLNEASVIISYNGKRFDIPHLNREFALLGLAPPAPYRQVDLYQTIKRVFRFPSNKLEYVTKALGVKAKDAHKRFPGFDLWLGIIREDPDPRAQKEMKTYNEIDVIVTEQLYDRLLPWLPHPSWGVFLDQDDTCPNCGGTELVKEGFAWTSASRYQRYRCKSCHKYSRSTKKCGGTNVTGLSS